MINLLPPQVKEDIRFGRLNVSALQYAVLALIIGACLVAVLLFGVIIAGRDQNLLRQSVEEKQQRLEGLSSDLAKANALSERIDTIGALLDREIKFSELFPAIGAVVPNGVTVSSLELDNADASNLTIVGESQTQNGPTVFRENIAKTEDLFIRADIVSITLVEGEGVAPSYQFSIDVQFRGGAKTGGDS